MKKDEWTFSKEDLEEIFGEKILSDEKKLEKEAQQEIKEISKSIVANKSKIDELESYSEQNKSEIKKSENMKTLNFNDDKTKEKETLSFPDFLQEKILLNIFEFNEEIRSIIEKELSEILPKKTVFNMLLRTLEKTAVNHLILRNTNFSMDGKIRENGSVDIERLLQNIEKYKTQIMEIDKEIENALKTLFYMRMNVIKAGLGQKYYEVMKGNILKKLNIVRAGYSNAIFNFFENNILLEMFN